MTATDPELGTTAELFGVDVSITTYDHAVDAIMGAARSRQSFGVSALAVHGLMEARSDDALRRKLRDFGLVTPDGQPIRWALNALHGASLTDRVYGPDLTWKVIEAAAGEGIGLFLFGSTEDTCRAFESEIRRRFPDVVISGVQPDRFREASAEEDEADVIRINRSGAGVVLVGRGCPRQEHWVGDHLGRIDAAMLAVGAAFDYGAGTLKQPPKLMQDTGLQWLYRLTQEPSRLWRRYLTTNTRYILLFAQAWLSERRDR